MHRIRAVCDRLVDWFAEASSTTKSFILTGLFFVVYIALGERIPGWRQVGWWPDKYPFPFLVTFVSLWAILLAIAVLKTSKAVERLMFQLLDGIRSLLEQIGLSIDEERGDERTLMQMQTEQTAMLEAIHTLTLGQSDILDTLKAHFAGDMARMTVAAPTIPMEAIPLPPARPVGSLHVSGPNGELPDPVGTPGAVNPAVTPATLATTIGAPNWTAGIRPPVSFTNALKAQQMREYGLTGDPSEYEEDHLVPLECGGAPHDPANLWPQRREGPWGARVKDLTENAARAAILSGAMSLADVQAGFKSDWTALHTKLLANVTPEMALHLMMMEPPGDEP